MKMSSPRYKLPDLLMDPVGVSGGRGGIGNESSRIYFWFVLRPPVRYC